ELVETDHPRLVGKVLPVRIGDQALDGGGHRIVITSA
ncbi:hypothetical protein, partial [Pseudomonas aeruginosa]